MIPGLRFPRPRTSASDIRDRVASLGFELTSWVSEVFQEGEKKKTPVVTFLLFDHGWCAQLTPKDVNGRQG